MSYEALLSAQHNHPALYTARYGELESAHGGDRARSDALHTMQKIQVHDEDTLGSGSGSGISDISALENETDTLGRAIMQHERDARRLRDVLHADQPPLVKTRARPRVADIMARQERQEIVTSSRHQDRVGSSGSNDSEPPLNIPREWGVRARSHRGWMRKIREPSEADIQLPQVEDAVKSHLTPDEDAIAPHRTAYSGDDYWSSPSDDRLPAVEDTPPSMNRHRTSSQPSSLRHMNTTLRHIMDSEDQDFSELSLLASTPAVTRTRKTLGSLAGREVESIEQKERVDRGLQQLSARLTSNRSRRRRSRDGAMSPTAGTAGVTTTDVYEPRPVTAPPANIRPGVTHRRSLIGNKENIPVNGRTGTQYKGSETVTITDRTAQAVTFKQPQRPGHARNDSMKLLQRLARVSSMSPSPKGSSSNDPAVRSEQDPSHQRPNTSHSDLPVDRNMLRSGLHGNNDKTDARRFRTRSLGDQYDQNQFAAMRASDQHEDDELPTPVDEADELHQVSLRNARDKPVNVKENQGSTMARSTDVRPLLRATDSTILRAFGTPSGEAALEGPNPHDSDPAHVGDTKSMSNRPRSALEDIMREARENPGGPFGDNTMQSLEDIAHPNLDVTDTTLTLDASANATSGEAEVIKLGGPLTQAERERRNEDLVIDGMDRHLRAASSNIQDVSRGLRRVENRVDNANTEPAEPALVSTAEPPKTVKPISATPTWCTKCEICGGSYRSVWRALFGEILYVFYHDDPSARFGIRLTWLGVLVPTFLLWYLAEYILCSYYCHPKYAKSMVGFGVDPDAPRWPFVVPTLTFRPLRPVWRPVVNWLEPMYTAAFNLVIGTPEEPWVHPEMQVSKGTPGYKSLGDWREKRAWQTKWTGSIASSTLAAAARVTRSFVDAVDEIGLMGDDEWLT